MQEKVEFCNIYKRVQSIDSKILESSHKITTNLFSLEQDLEILKHLHPNKLHSFIKPLAPHPSQSFEIQSISSDPKIISYTFFQSSYGKLLIAATQTGICYISFVSDENVNELQQSFPTSTLECTKVELHQVAIDYIEDKSNSILPLHLKGTEFQIEVWKNLLRIPKGQLSTYKNIALAIGKPKASIAIGAAVGKNPIALLIPCHRIIRTNGIWSGFRWGNERKASLLIYELK